MIYLFIRKERGDLYMSDEEYRRIFVKKLNYYMNLNNKKQIDLMNDLGLSSATVSSWCTGTKLPRMGKIQMLADYLGIEKSDLLEEKTEGKKQEYYLNDEAKEMAQFMHDNPEYKVLFDATRKVKKEDLDTIKAIIDKFSEG